MGGRAPLVEPLLKKPLVLADTNGTNQGTDMDVSPALLVDRVLQMEQGQSAQAAQLAVLKKAMDMNESASQALISAATGDLPLAPDGALGTQVNTLV
jgi:hypothetical protein